MIWWIDAGSGASGDMLMAALLDLDPTGLPEAQTAVDDVLARLGAGSVQLSTQPVRRAGMAANRAIVKCEDDSHRRTWADIEPALVDYPVASEAFAALARAEAAVHGTDIGQIHFHEVGALDAIADIVGVTTLWQRLAPQQIVVSPVCVGSGSVRTQHGTLQVPVPAVAELLRGVPTFGGSVAHEACTPTGAALLSTMATAWGPQPQMAVDRIAIGAGGRDLPGQPNVLRILAGTTADTAQRLLLVETTIDDLDPRLYPDVLAAAKNAGALETWLTPTIMKHGRPAVTLTALAAPGVAPAIADVLFRHTNTLGVRFVETHRQALDRDWVEVQVADRTVRVKRGWLNGDVVTVQPEFADASAVAQERGLAVKDVIASAVRAATADGARSGQKKGSDATDGGDSDVRTLRK